jgi:hypothetical protein
LRRPGVERTIDRMTPIRGAALLAVLLLAGCAGAAAPPGSAGSRSGVTLSPAVGSGGSGPIDTPDEAAARVIASEPRFKNVHRKDPNLIGQCCWYEAAAGQDGFRVKITMGWGDCPAGCIESHVWTYEVSRSGEIRLVGESGDPVPPGGIGNT